MGAQMGSRIRQNGIMFRIEADYVQVVGLEMTNSQQWGLTVSGSFCYVAECISHDNWYTSFRMRNINATTKRGSVFRWLQAYRTRHANGCILEVSETMPGFLMDNVVAECLFYSNGYQPDGQKVSGLRPRTRPEAEL